jgi:ectoine hydroxylase-related dioxygenase (phytanoyl-CoA dioxygenase family)
MNLMLTPQQIAHYKTFGFLFISQAFSADEMEAITREAEAVWEEDREGQPVPEKGQHLTYFVEQRPALTKLVDDARILGTVESLLGTDLIWVGSEGNFATNEEHGWRSDRKYFRPEENSLIDYPQIKMMMYLDSVTRDTGCLRVIPGSHRMPMHKELGIQETGSRSNPFSLEGPDLPCCALESKPGDLVFFNHCLFHAIFGGWGGRRYIAIKYAVPPSTTEEIESLQRYTTNIFEPHEALLNNECPRIRELVKDLVGMKP